MCVLRCHTEPEELLWYAYASHLICTLLSPHLSTYTYKTHLYSRTHLPPLSDWHRRQSCQHDSSLSLSAQPICPSPRGTPSLYFLFAINPSPPPQCQWFHRVMACKISSETNLATVLPTFETERAMTTYEKKKLWATDASNFIREKIQDVLMRRGWPWRPLLSDTHTHTHARTHARTYARTHARTHPISLMHRTTLRKREKKAADMLALTSLHFTWDPTTFTAMENNIAEDFDKPEKTDHS